MTGTIAQGRAFTVCFTLLTLSAGAGCDTVRSKLQPYVCEPAAAGSGAHLAGAGSGARARAAGAAAPVQDSTHDSDALEDPAEHALDTPPLTAAGKFALPFAWEKSPTEPLSRARTFLREMADDNAQHMTKQGAALRGYAAAETPRTTVLTCSDSRVHASVFDSSPENDDYMVRNLGNQVEVSVGAVQYGVERLSTPVLLILGHTGCEAVRAAASDTALGDPIRRELAGIHVKKVRGRLDDKRLTSAVLDNVHGQVKAALKRFSGRVTSNDLTIVGAVYDLRNELGRGAGRLSVINVNGNRDEARLKAFMDAIMASPNPKAKQASNVRENPLDRLARALAESTDSEDDEDDDDDEEATPQSPGTVPAGEAH